MTADCTDPDAGTPTEPARYRIEPDEQPSLAVVRAVATTADCDPVDGGALEPLAESVDPEALDRLFESRLDGTDVAVEFQYAGYQITVRVGESACVTVR